MLKEKRINYAIGFVFGCLLLGIMAIPFLGNASCYELIDALSLMKTLGESNPKITATCSFIILSIIFISLMVLLAVTGFVLKCTKYKSGKTENVISWIYSSFIFAVIASVMTMLILLLVWSTSAEYKLKIGMLITVILILLFPYLSATKMNLAFAVYNVATSTYVGAPVLLLHLMVFAKRYKKNDTKISESLPSVNN